MSMNKSSHSPVLRVNYSDVRMYFCARVREWSTSSSKFGMFVEFRYMSTCANSRRPVLGQHIKLLSHAPPLSLYGNNYSASLARQTVIYSVAYYKKMHIASLEYCINLLASTVSRMYCRTT